MTETSSSSIPRQLRVEEIGDGMYRTTGAAVNIAFTRRGEGTAVVLMHGTSANHAVWEDVAEAIAPRATVISLDQRGHGRSDKPSQGYSGPDFVDDVITVLDALGIKTALAVGHSLGGRNAWLAAALYPDRITGAVVVDYTPFVEAEQIDLLDQRVSAGFRSFGALGEVEAYLTQRYPRLPAESIRRRTRWGYDRDKNGQWLPLASPDGMQQLIDGFRTPWDAQFRAVPVRMTHIRGALSTLVSEDAWESARVQRPNDRWVVVDDADHYVTEERPDAVAAEIEATLLQGE